MSKKIKKIAVTGTKGKTTVVNFIAEILRNYHYSRVLHVNTTGHFINGERRSTLNDSKRTWGLVPSVSSGRYLYEFIHRAEDEDVAAVLEMSLGCSSLSGMGVAMHDVGIMLNIFGDHIGSSKRLNSQEDLVEAKRFVFTRILRDGFAVMNIDDPYVMSALPSVPAERCVKALFFGLNVSLAALPSAFNTAAFVTLRNGVITYIDESRNEVPIVAAKDIVWTFDGAFTPSLYNALAIVSGVIASFGGVVPAELGLKLANTRMDHVGGRLTRLRSAQGVEIIADYAHEKKSLTEIARLGKSLTRNGGKVIGVVRLAYDRTDELLTETGKAIAKEYDFVIVYDKIDGFWKKAAENLQFDRFPQIEGRTSEVLFAAVHGENPSSERIVREDEAIHRAAELARQGDVVVVIVNDDIERSIGFIKDAFKADFQ